MVSRVSLSRVRSLYTNIAVICFNLLLILSIFLLAIYGISTIRHIGRSGFSEKYSPAFDRQSYSIIDNTSIDQLFNDCDLMGEHQSFVYNPWTSFMVGPYTGRQLNVKSDPILNHRVTPPLSDVMGSDFVVWMFGGSTLFGWGLSDDTTVAAQLQKILQEMMPNKRVMVVNFGQPYWFSSVELAILPALLRDRRAPDVALFLDGLNDTVWGLEGLAVPPLADRAHFSWERTKADARRELPWFTVNNSFPGLRVVEWLRRKGLAPETKHISHFRSPNADPVAHIVRNYRKNRRMATQLLAGADVRPLFVLQPVPFWGIYKSPGANQGLGAPGKGKDVYAALAQEAATAGSDLVDLSAVLVDVDRPYVDPAHYSDGGAKILAEAIANLIGNYGDGAPN